jgi:hypothetical protein
MLSETSVAALKLESFRFSEHQNFLMNRSAKIPPLSGRLLGRRGYQEDKGLAYLRF